MAHARKMKPLHLVWKCVYRSCSGKSIDNCANVSVTVALRLAIAATINEVLQIHILSKELACNHPKACRNFNICIPTAVAWL